MSSNASPPTRRVFIAFSPFLVLTAVVLVLHSRHLLLVRRLLCFQSHDLVVYVRRKYANEGHHALHEAAPPWPQAVVLRLVHHFVHGHHRPLHESVLREAGNLIGIFRKLLLAVLHALHFAILHTGHFLVQHSRHRLLSTFLAQWTVGSGLVIGRTNSQASPET